MTKDSKRSILNRRAFMASLLAGTALSRQAFAQQAGAPLFSFDWLKNRMQNRAAQPEVPVTALQGFLNDLTYDDYRNIFFRPEAERWQPEELPFYVSAFHPGWLFHEPVYLNEIVDGQTRPMTFSTDDFGYRNSLEGTIPPHAELPGIAGVKIRYPLNTPEIHDELITFVGASYFRALGKGNSYGLSARGLSINTWLQGPEEFPRFSEFWLERPAIGDRSLTFYAAMDSASVTGAYRFVVTPGKDTVVEVEAALFFREDVKQLGLGPLTSMFYFNEHSERRFDDYRLQVHDSDAVRIVKSDGDVLHRPLNNPPRVANSYFTESDLQAFGLIQRDRDYESYEDAGARYHDRPSVMIEPVGDWGPGAVRLVEIPADLEIDDNIVLFWVPEHAPKAGEARTYSYRMHWGALPANADGPLAFVASTRTGVGGPSGVPIENPNWRKFVIDLEGGELGGMPNDAEVAPVVWTSAGTVTGVVLHKVPEAATDRWRLVIDLDGGDADLIEMSAHVAGYGRKLSESWMYQWVRDV